MGLVQGLVTLETVSETLSGTNAFVTGSVSDSSGRFRVTNIGSPAQYGGFVQAGSITTSAGSLATIVFGRQWTGVGTYYIAAQPINGSGNFFISGTQRASGCELVGNASTLYNWIAVGL